MTHPQQPLIAKLADLIDECKADRATDAWQAEAVAALAALSAGAVPQQEPQDDLDRRVHVEPKQVLAYRQVGIPVKATPRVQASQDVPCHDAICPQCGHYFETNIPELPAVPALPAPQEQDRTDTLIEGQGYQWRSQRQEHP